MAPIKNRTEFVVMAVTTLTDGNGVSSVGYSPLIIDKDFDEALAADMATAHAFQRLQELTEITELQNWDERLGYPW